MLEFHNFGGSDAASEGPGHRSDERGVAAQHAGVPAPVSASAVGRPATARRPGDGVRLPPVGDRARRADDRPRRQHAGARAHHDSRTVPRPQGGRAVRHARPRRRRQPGRPGCGDVRRSDRRAGAGAGVVRQSRASVHAAPDRRSARHVDRSRDGRSQRPRSGAGPAPGRLLVRRALRAGRRRVPRRVPSRSRGRPRPAGAVHPAVRGTAAHAARRRPFVADRRVGDARADGPRPVRLVHPPPGGAQRRSARRPRRVPGVGRRIRSRQDHAVALDRRPAPRVDRRDPARLRALGAVGP